MLQKFVNKHMHKYPFLILLTHSSLHLKRLLELGKCFLIFLWLFFQYIKRSIYRNFNYCIPILSLFLIFSLTSPPLLKFFYVLSFFLFIAITIHYLFYVIYFFISSYCQKLLLIFLLLSFYCYSRNYNLMKSFSFLLNYLFR